MTYGRPTGLAVVRWLGCLAATVVAAAVAAVVVTSLVDRGQWEQAVIGLTSESEWPMHDVHLATVAGQLDDPDLVLGVQAEVGLADSDDISVVLDRQRQAGSGVVIVSAHADNATDAAAMANAVAEEMVERVQPNTPVRLVDRADGNEQTASTSAVLVSGALVGLIIGLIVWTAPVIGRQRSIEP